MRSFFFAALALGGATLAVTAACTGDDPAQCVGPQCTPTEAGTNDAPQQGAITVTIPKRPIVTQGSSVALDVEVARSGFNGPITIAVDGLPANVSASAATLAPDATKVSVTLTATAAAVQGETTITVSGSDATGSVKGSAQTPLLVRGVPGTLDATFGEGGKVTLKIDGNGYQVAGVVVQPDGKTLVAGTIDNDFVVTRFDLKGAADESFGIKGRATTDFRLEGGVTVDQAYGVALVPDGTIVVSGYTVQPYSMYALARFLPDGKRDNQFDGDGYNLFDYEPDPTKNGDRFANAVVIQPDGKAVFAGTILNGAESHDLVLARVTTQGALDPTFVSEKGFATFAVGAATNDVCHAAAIDPNGIVCGGESENRFVALRVNSSGAKDNAFAGGIVPVEFPNEQASAKSVAVLGDRTVRLAGTVGTKLGVAQITPAGLPDTAFNTTGRMTFDFGSPSPVFGGAVMDASGRLIIVALNGAANDIALAAVKGDGTVDATFGTGGKLITPVSGNSYNGVNFPRIALAPDGRIVVATRLETGQLVVLRYWN